jgi:formylglycine-generating enzyme required for sulfatase activity
VEPVTGMVFVRVNAGRFVMGSPPGEAGREEREVRHDVTISRPFWLGAYELTQRQWRTVMGDDPSWFHGDDGTMPVENVSWLAVQEFLERLGARSPKGRFRLPTEAEWEYACRAGTATAYGTGPAITLADANFEPPPEGGGAGRGRTTPVGTYPPNAWGLYDMSGNVWEWTGDEPCPYPPHPVTDPVERCGDPLRVIRGGSWHFGVDSARCALRYTHRPEDRGFSLGFRVVWEPAGGQPAARR